MSQQQLNQIFDMANEAIDGEDFEKSAAYYRMLLHNTEVQIDEGFQLTAENIRLVMLYFESNLGLANSLCASTDFLRAEKVVLSGLNKIRIIISNLSIPMIYRALMMTAYKNHFHTLSWIYLQGDMADKLKDYVMMHAGSLENWKSGVAMVSMETKNLN